MGQCLARLLGAGGEDTAGGTRLDDHDGQRVGDDVVHLAGDSSLFVGERLVRHHLAFSGEMLAALFEIGDALAAPPDVVAHHERGAEHDGVADDVAERAECVMADHGAADIDERQPADERGGRAGDAPPIRAVRPNRVCGHERAELLAGPVVAADLERADGDDGDDENGHRPAPADDDRHRGAEREQHGEHVDAAWGCAHRRRRARGRRGQEQPDPGGHGERQSDGEVGVAPEAMSPGLEQGLEPSDCRHPGDGTPCRRSGRPPCGGSPSTERVRTRTTSRANLDSVVGGASLPRR